jgi:hypothetical protein
MLPHFYYILSLSYYDIICGLLFTNRFWVLDETKPQRRQGRRQKKITQKKTSPEIRENIALTIISVEVT